MTQKIVLTGGPGSGKSTLIEYLGKRGYETVPEVATIVIKEQLANKGTLLPWTDRTGFQKEVLRRQLEFESQIQETAILDRGVPDGLAYYLLDNLKSPSELQDASKNNRYDTVFLLSMINPENTQIRREDAETAIRLGGLLKEVYTQLGYRPIGVPVAPIQQRADIILKELNRR